MRSVEWVLIQYDWCPHEKKGSLDPETHTEDVKIQKEEGGHVTGAKHL